MPPRAGARRRRYSLLVVVDLAVDHAGVVINHRVHAGVAHHRSAAGEATGLAGGPVGGRQAVHVRGSQDAVNGRGRDPGAGRELDGRLTRGACAARRPA